MLHKKPNSSPVMASYGVCFVSTTSNVCFNVFTATLYSLNWAAWERPVVILNASVVLFYNTNAGYAHINKSW